MIDSDRHLFAEVVESVRLAVGRDVKPCDILVPQTRVDTSVRTRANLAVKNLSIVFVRLPGQRVPDNKVDISVSGGTGDLKIRNSDLLRLGVRGLMPDFPARSVYLNLPYASFLVNDAKGRSVPCIEPDSSGPALDRHVVYLNDNSIQLGRIYVDRVRSIEGVLLLAQAATSLSAGGLLLPEGWQRKVRGGRIPDLGSIAESTEPQPYEFRQDELALRDDICLWPTVAFEEMKKKIRTCLPPVDGRKKRCGCGYGEGIVESIAGTILADVLSQDNELVLRLSGVDHDMLIKECEGDQFPWGKLGRCFNSGADQGLNELVLRATLKGIGQAIIINSSLERWDIVTDSYVDCLGDSQGSKLNALRGAVNKFANSLVAAHIILNLHPTQVEAPLVQGWSTPKRAPRFFPAAGYNTHSWDFSYGLNSAREAASNWWRSDTPTPTPKVGYEVKVSSDLQDGELTPGERKALKKDPVDERKAYWSKKQQQQRNLEKRRKKARSK